MTLFTNETTAVSMLQTVLSTGASQYFNVPAYTSDQLYQIILSAEKEASRDLRVFFEPTVITVDDALQSEIESLEDSVASFDGWIAGRVLTVDSITSGALAPLQSIIGAQPGTIINSQLTGVSGGAGTYSISIPQSLGTAGNDVALTSLINWFQEAGYDYDPDFFAGEKWGYIRTKQKPIISVQSIQFSYPSPTNTIFSIPPEWIRFDRKYGDIRLVPAAMAFQAPLSAFIMQALGGGRTIPFMIQVRYTAGFSNPVRDYPDLIDLIYKMAAFRLLFGAFLPDSGSISADGLSQSQSIKYESWRKEIESKLNAFRESIHGIRLACV